MQEASLVPAGGTGLPVQAGSRGSMKPGVWEPPLPSLPHATRELDFPLEHISPPCLVSCLSPQLAEITPHSVPFLSQSLHPFDFYGRPFCT